MLLILKLTYPRPSPAKFNLSSLTAFLENLVPFAFFFLMIDQHVHSQ